MRSTEGIEAFTNLFLASDDEFNGFSDHKHEIEEEWEGFTDNSTDLTVIPPPPNTDEAIDDDEFILITRLEAQAQAKPQTKAALPRPILKRFRIEDNDNNNERETDGDEINKIGNNNDYIHSEEPEEVSKSSLERVIRSRETRKKPRKNLPYY